MRAASYFIEREKGRLNRWMIRSLCRSCWFQHASGWPANKTGCYSGCAVAAFRFLINFSLFWDFYNGHQLLALIFLERFTSRQWSRRLWFSFSWPTEANCVHLWWRNHRSSARPDGLDISGPYVPLPTLGIIIVEWEPNVPRLLIWWPVGQNYIGD